MKVLIFNKNIKEYQKFKPDFTNQVLPKFASVEAATYALISCLGEILHETKKNIYNNIDENQNKLVESYGKISILVDVIMNQIWRFGAIKQKHEKRFIEFVVIVEKRYRVLSRMKNDNKLSNTIAISIIEQKLPKITRKGRAQKSVKKAARWKNQINFLYC